MKIKVRAWHIKAKKMFSAEEMAKDQLALLPDGRFCNVHAHDTKLSTFPPMIPLQFAGITDASGRDIYEGDVIQYDDGAGEKGTGVVIPFFDTCNLHVSWIEQRFDRPSLYTSTDYLGCAKELKILGNKYENPELLDV